MQFIEREIKHAGRLFEPSRVFLDSPLPVVFG